VRKWVDEVYSIDPEDMQGACAISSYTVYRLLRSKGYEAEFVMAMDADDCEGHCYVELKNWVIDLTPKQFDSELSDILVIKKEKYIETIPKLKKYVRITRGKRAMSQLKEWSKEQSPITYRGKINYLIKKAA
jgi:predicted DNA-binding protein (UPF0278 family)